MIPVVSIIVVSFNTRDTTLKCLRELKSAAEGIDSQIIVVDNASTDGSVDAIRSAMPEVTIISNGVNVGFASANNQALAGAKGRFILLLNSDAFMQSGGVAAMVDYLRQNPQIAAVGPRLLNADGSLQISCFPFPSPWRAWVENLWLSRVFSGAKLIGDYRQWDHNSPRVVDFVSGACMMIRREVYEQIGGFDDRFFMYAEETDWQKRMWRNGWKIAFTPAAVVTHLGGGSKNDANRSRLNFFNSLDIYEYKHHGLMGLILLRCAMIVGCAARVVAWAIKWMTSSAHRNQAESKLRLHLWLIWRQLTRWHLPPVWTSP
jgi:GT2 family glycosyltransferase